MLLSAGRGDRMLPLTAMLPKPAIPVLGRPIAVQILQRLALQGIGTVVLNVHHFPERIRSLLGEGGSLGLERIFYSYEAELLGTAGGIRKASPFLRGGGTILIRNADFLADIDLRGVTAAHLASGKPVTLVLAPHRPGYSVVEVDAQGLVVSLAGEPEADPAKVAGRYLFTGFQLIEEDALGEIPPDGPCDLVRHVYRKLCARGEIASVLHRGFWWEFGTPRDYLDGSLRLLAAGSEARGRVVESDRIVDTGEARLAVGAGAEFHNAVNLRGGVALGMACHLAEGSRVEDSVIMSEAWIGPGSDLRRVIVAPGSEIPAGFEMRDALVCPEIAKAPLPPETERLDGLLVRRFGPPGRE